MTNNRIVWVDYAKTINLFFVVIGHTALPYEYRSIIYTFHIPLFFFLSGLFFDYNKYPDYLGFLKKRISQLLVPYLIFNLITYLAWLFIGRYTGEDAKLNINPIDPLVGVFYGNTNGDYLHHNVPMWFLACLFLVENIFYLTFRKANTFVSLILIMLFLTLGLIEKSYNIISLPWGLNVLPVAIVLYGTGYFFKNKIGFQSKFFNTFLILLFGLPVILLIAHLNGKVEVSNAEYGNYLYFWIGAFAGIISIVSLSKLIERYNPKIKIFQYIGSNTLIIFSFHLLAGGIVKAITLYVFQLPMSIYQTPLVNVIYSLVSILILLPVVYFINTQTPFIIGRDKLKK